MARVATGMYILAMTAQRVTGTIPGSACSCALGSIIFAGYHLALDHLAPMEPRDQPTCALVYVLQGHARYRDTRGERDLGQGDLLIILPSNIYSYNQIPGSGPYSECYLAFSGPVFDLWRSAKALDAGNPVLRLDQVDYWLRRIEEVAMPGGNTMADTALARVCRLQALLADALFAADEVRMRGQDRAWLDHACRLLQEDANGGNGDWPVLAARLDMTYERFRKRFAQLAGVAPAHYRMARVMDRACELLRSGELPLREIASRCGFCDEFHFSRRFKQVIGVPPSAFRGRSAPLRDEQQPARRARR